MMTEMVSENRATWASTSQSSSKVQEWLFFGFLTVLLRQPILRSELVYRNKEGQDILTTRHLPSLLQRSQEEDSPPDRYMDDSLKTSHKAIRYLAIRKVF